MHVLATGSCGFIGSHVVEELLAAGHDVRVLADLSTGRRRHLPPEVEVVVGDVADATVTAAALAGVEAVCHQAAKFGLGSGSRTSRTTCAATTSGRPCCCRVAQMLRTNGSHLPWKRARNMER